jgi:Ca-activated chloride channel family protein
MPAPMGIQKMSAPMAPPAQLVIPPADREVYADTPPNPVHLTAEEPVSTFSSDVDTAAYANVRRFLLDGRAPPTDAVRLEELINYFDYDYAPPKDAASPFTAAVEITPSPWSAGRELMRIGVQGYDIPRAERPPLNLTLLLDVSGSMNEENKLPLAVKALRILVEEMTERDRIAIVVYAGAAGAVLEPTSGAEKQTILAALDQLSAGGSTAGGEGLRLAYNLARRSFVKDGVNRVMLMTDGDFNVGLTNAERLEDFVARERESGVYLSVIGFGEDNYNDALMQTLAQSGNGVAAYIDTLNEARKVFSDDLSGSMFPIADDLKIQVDFNPAAVAEYRLIGYETRILRREDFNNDRVDAGDIGAGHSVTALYELTPTGSKARLLEPSRYAAAPALAGPASSEIAYVKLRYKPPGSDTSRLIEQAVTAKDRVSDFARASEATRFAAAVAGYGGLLRADPYLDASFDWDDVISIASGAKGKDRFGYRAEFIQLARLAKSAVSMAPAPRPGTGEH